MWLLLSSVPLRDSNPDVCRRGWGGSVVAPEILHSLPRLVFGIERAIGGDVSRVGLRYLAYRVVARPVLVVCLRGDEISALEQCGLDPRVEELHCPPVEEVATGGLVLGFEVCDIAVHDVFLSVVVVDTSVSVVVDVVNSPGREPVIAR